MFKKVFAAVKAFVLKAGTTPFGKAVEHAAVTAGSLAISDLLYAAYRGTLTFPSAKLIVIGALATFFTAARAALKMAYPTVPFVAPPAPSAPPAPPAA